MMKQQLRFSDFQSLDAMWNAGMPSYAGPHHRTLLTNSMDYQGQNLTLTYENGQEVTVESVPLFEWEQTSLVCELAKAFTQVSVIPTLR